MAEVYPDVISDVPATLPIVFSSNQAILSTEFENGIEQRRLLWDSVRRDVTINYAVLPFSYGTVLKGFYVERQGSFKSFYFFAPQVEGFSREFCGSASGGETTINLPSKGAQSYTLYRDGVSLSEGSDYSFVSGGGPNGEDRANLNFSAVFGDVYHFTFAGRLKLRVRFDTGGFTIGDVKNMLSSTTVALVGLTPILV